MKSIAEIKHELEVAEAMQNLTWKKVQETQEAHEVATREWQPHYERQQKLQMLLETYTAATADAPPAVLEFLNRPLTLSPGTDDAAIAKEPASAAPGETPSILKGATLAAKADEWNEKKLGPEPDGDWD